MGKLLTRHSLRREKGQSLKRQSRKQRSLRDLNRLLTSEHDDIVRKARANCVRLTGRETL